MFTPTPAVRAVLIGLVIVTVVALAGAGLHLRDVEARAERGVGTSLDAHAAGLAAALAPDGASRAALEAAFRAAAPVDRVDFTLFDLRGQVAATTNRALSDRVNWLREGRREAAIGPIRLDAGDVPYWMAARAVPGGGGWYVGAMAPSTASVAVAEAMLPTMATMAALWLLLAGALVLMGWYAGPRTSTHLERLGQRLAHGDADASALIRHAQLELGPFAHVFSPIIERMTLTGGQVGEHREHVAALYQVNPSYVVLCTFDGRVVEANPAFYAITGLPPDILRNGPIEALRETFPIEPLMEFARRSLDEGASISGVEYALVSHDDETRPVEVSLRAFPLGGTPVVLIQATDFAARRTLERRVAAFSDTLDLMVDQRVSQLTAGHQSLRRVLDRSGIVVASFDAGGATRRWSGAAQALSGRTASDVPHVASVASVLGLTDVERTAFMRWFWGPSPEPFLATHSNFDAAGRVRTRTFVWRKVDADRPGQTDHRTLVGVEVPDVAAASGDGQMGHSPAPHRMAGA